MIINGLHMNGNMRGFTLLELLIAIAFLATGFLAAAAMQGVAMNANSYANRISVATMVGQQVAEDLCSLKITDTLLHTSVTNATYNRLYDPGTKASTAGTVSIPGAGTFSAQYDIAPNTPVTGTTQITVRVFYNGSATPVITFSTCKLVVS
jgi:prepilin-type N-terminal cleavage/methylation domain-containing protein